IKSIVAYGDDVVFRWEATGFHSGDGLGAAASNQQVSFEGITWHRFRDGKLIEGWNFWNHLGLVQRLSKSLGTRPTNGIDCRRRRSRKGIEASRSVKSGQLSQKERML